MVVFPYRGKINNPRATLGPVLVCVLGITLLTVGCNTQQTRQSSAAGSQNMAGEKVASNGPKLVCRREQQTGSHFTTKICKYQAEWDAIDNAEQEGSAEYIRRTDDRTGAAVGSNAGADPYAGQGMAPNSQ